MDRIDRLIEFLCDAITEACAPVFVCRREDSPASEVNDNGTCGFVDTGERKLLITAQHVVDSFRSMKRKSGEGVFSVNVGPGNTIGLSDLAIVDEESSLDIAVLEFPYLDNCGGLCTKRYFPIRQFPIPCASVGEGLSLVGFPGVLRKTGTDWGSFSPVSICYTISSVSDRQIILADEHGDRRTVGKGFRDGEVPFGGFSGSPAYIIRQDGAHLAGFLRAGSKETDSPINLPGVVFISPARYLRPDGTLDRSMMGWLHA